jgi:hypothetical protein
MITAISVQFSGASRAAAAEPARHLPVCVPVIGARKGDAVGQTSRHAQAIFGEEKDSDKPFG